VKHGLHAFNSGERNCLALLDMQSRSDILNVENKKIIVSKLSQMAHFLLSLIPHYPRLVLRS